MPRKELFYPGTGDSYHHFEKLEKGSKTPRNPTMNGIEDILDDGEVEVNEFERPLLVTEDPKTFY